jgi:hypothetical protein
MTPLISVEMAWQLLHNDVPRLFEKATFNFAGKLKPGQGIQAEIARDDIELSICLEICHKGNITSSHEVIPNMATSQQIWTH